MIYNSITELIQSVQIERQQLAGRIDKLRDFLNSGEFFALPMVHRALLAHQYTHMGYYLQVLDERLRILMEVEGK